jgi:hypothetical protein
MAHQHEQSIEELLNDPLTLALMQADRIDPAALRADLIEVARRLPRRDIVLGRRPIEPGVTELRRLLADCIASSARKGGATAHAATDRH